MIVQIIRQCWGLLHPPVPILYTWSVSINGDVCDTVEAVCAANNHSDVCVKKDILASYSSHPS